MYIYITRSFNDLLKGQQRKHLIYIEHHSIAFEQILPVPFHFLVHAFVHLVYALYYLRFFVFHALDEGAMRYISIVLPVNAVLNATLLAQLKKRFIQLRNGLIVVLASYLAYETFLILPERVVLALAALDVLNRLGGRRHKRIKPFVNQRRLRAIHLAFRFVMVNHRRFLFMRNLR